MAVYLNDIEGNPISLMGSGSTQWSQGTGVNSASFGGNTLFGKHLASGGQPETTPGAFASTVPGSTSRLGYTDPLKSRPGVSGGGMDAFAPDIAPRQLNAPKELKPDSTVGSMAVKAIRKQGGAKEPGAAGQVPPEGAAGRALATGAANIGLGMYQGAKNASAASRLGNFADATASSRPEQQPPTGLFSAAGTAASGTANDLDEDV